MICRTDPETIKKAEGIKAEIMGREEVTGLASSTWQVAKRLIMESVDDPNSTLRTKVAENVAGFGVRLRDDESMREKVDGWLVQGTKYIAENYTDEITGVISDTVERWDADEASQKIELQVGRDLQFIRINGTVVGSIAGLLIYTISTLIFG